MTGLFSRRWLTGTAITAVALVVAGLAAREVLTGPDRDVVEDASYVLAEAMHGTVEQSLQLNVSVSWLASSSFATQASGMLTEVVHSDGDEITAGEVLFTVNLEPVFVAEGEVPAFRTLADGVEGTDVVQLQQFLAQAGYFTGEVNGKFDYRVRWAVRAWQEDLDQEVTGAVEVGTMLFLPELPARVSLGEEIKVGSGVAPGMEAVELLPSSPNFTIELPDSQARMAQPGMGVDIAAEDSVWQATITEIVLDESEIHRAKLEAVEGDSICGEECGQIPLGEPTLLPSTIHIVPAVEGVTVPAAAITTDASGATAVVTAAGEAVTVEVLAGAGGTVVVEGIEAGQRVRATGREDM